MRNLIIRYSNENDFLLDPMIGGGTTAIECKLLNRNLLALDINPNAIEITQTALEFESEFNPKIKLDINDSFIKLPIVHFSNYLILFSYNHIIN